MYLHVFFISSRWREHAQLQVDLGRDKIHDQGLSYMVDGTSINKQEAFAVIRTFPNEDGSRDSFISHLEITPKKTGEAKFAELSDELKHNSCDVISTHFLLQPSLIC